MRPDCWVCKKKKADIHRWNEKPICRECDKLSYKDKMIKEGVNDKV